MAADRPRGEHPDPCPDRVGEDARRVPVRNQRPDRQPAGEARGHTLYLSPLKALATDIERNLQLLLSGIAQVAQTLEIEIPEISSGTRTSDTSQNER